MSNFKLRLIISFPRTTTMSQDTPLAVFYNKYLCCLVIISMSLMITRLTLLFLPQFLTDKHIASTAYIMPELI